MAKIRQSIMTAKAALHKIPLPPCIPKKTGKICPSWTPTPLTVACGAYVAGRAGEMAEQAVNPVSMTSADTVAHIGAAVSEILEAE